VEIDSRAASVTTTTHTSVVGDNWLKTFYNATGQLIKTTDSAQEASGVTEYFYDEKKRLTRIKSHSSSDNISTTEEHQWTYNENGQPKSMLRIRSGSDSTLVEFSYDEKGNVAEEKTVKSRLPLATVYYYYDANNRLTDIVRYNARAKRLLPDYMFEYNEAGQLTRMVSVPEGSNNYLTFYYQYNPNGLKRMDLCYDKQQQLVGKVEYAYN
jgi:antitoxin component YwqK of YwqJK toxin-antitoxin module